MRMQTNPPPVDPKVETPLELQKQEDTILEPIFAVIDNQLPH